MRALEKLVGSSLAPRTEGTRCRPAALLPPAPAPEVFLTKKALTGSLAGGAGDGAVGAESQHVLWWVWVCWEPRQPLCP